MTEEQVLPEGLKKIPDEVSEKLFEYAQQLAHAHYQTSAVSCLMNGWTPLVAFWGAAYFLLTCSVDLEDWSSSGQDPVDNMLKVLTANRPVFKDWHRQYLENVAKENAEDAAKEEAAKAARNSDPSLN